MGTRTASNTPSPSFKIPKLITQSYLSPISQTIGQLRAADHFEDLGNFHDFPLFSNSFTTTDPPIINRYIPLDTNDHSHNTNNVLQ